VRCGIVGHIEEIKLSRASNGVPPETALSSSLRLTGGSESDSPSSKDSPASSASPSASSSSSTSFFSLLSSWDSGSVFAFRFVTLCQDTGHSVTLVEDYTHLAYYSETSQQLDPLSPIP
jgi:hypothetical protein